MGKEPATAGRGKRICPSCELEFRKNEWSQLTEAERVNNPTYCIWEQVWSDMKSMNKGHYWAGT
eukprot:12924065-Prorocentrum_lima.AAC.1